MKWFGNAHRGPSSSISRVDDIHVYCRGDNLDNLQTTQRRQIPMNLKFFSSTACLALRREVAPAQPLSSSTAALTRTAGRQTGRGSYPRWNLIDWRLDCVLFHGASFAQVSATQPQLL